MYMNFLKFLFGLFDRSTIPMLFKHGRSKNGIEENISRFIDDVRLWVLNRKALFCFNKADSECLLYVVQL